MVRDYADQTGAAAQARARLAANSAASPAATAARQLWSGPNVDGTGTVSPDGRYLSSADWRTGGDIAIRDLQTGADRLLTKRRSAELMEYVGSSAISRDGRQVVYLWSDGTDRLELRVLPLHLQNAGPRTLSANREIAWIAPYDWSPDGRWIAVETSRRDRTGPIGLVSTSDGSVRVLKSIDWRGSGKLALSPDGRYLAYQMTPGEQRRSIEHLRVVVAVQSLERAYPRVSARLHYTRVLQWAPDGRSLLVAGTDLKGRHWLYSLDVATEDETPLVVADDGEYLLFGAWSPDGDRLYYSRQLSSSQS